MLRRGEAGRSAGQAGWTSAASPSLVGDLHTEGLFVLVFVIIDVNQDLLLPHSPARRKPQADGVGLASSHLEEALRPSVHPSCAHFASSCSVQGRSPRLRWARQASTLTYTQQLLET